MHEFELVHSEQEPTRRQQLKGDLAPRRQEGDARLSDLANLFEIEAGQQHQGEVRPFDLADPLAIEANRHGELTQAQITMFKQASWRYSGWWFMLVVASYALLVWTRPAPSVHLDFVFPLCMAVYMLVLASPSLITYIHRKRIKPALIEGKVEQVSGEVVRLGRRTLARSGERRLKMVDTMYPLPPDGRYLFFFLAGTNYLLSAQSLDGSEPGVMDQQAGEKLLVGLSRANGFSLDELATNREGRLSKRQCARLLVPLAMTCIGGLLAMAGIPLGIYLFVQWNLVQMPWFAWPVGVLGSFLLLGITLACGIHALLLIQDMRAEKVVYLDGKVVRLAYRMGQSSSATYQYTYETFIYNISKSAYRAFAPGLHYRIYQTPRTHRLMSLEPLDSRV